MSNDILKDIIYNKERDYINKKIIELVKNEPSILKEYPILEIEFNIDGNKKSLNSLSNERDIKETQIHSDINELDFKHSQGMISDKEYNDSIGSINDRLKKQNLVYDDLIFDIINDKDIDEIKEEIKNENLNDIALKRLASSLSSISEDIINDFQDNNKDFKMDKISYWNYKYNKLAKNYEKSRELENYILSLIE